ncbi:type I phosphodiesterase/nucleotide pyrophosphatase [Lutibacter sp. Hel_I_33_5]|uniref:alkaline phosphatase PafA n=1 Tax=Lutibacter sp. Hel_I_33_5 TaxID=1566289 RepID=UPI0011A770A2|nr:alkaline phosphatase PafA [Lutibacter sp. Hel_I_33_5]TVZ57025.1 type I phosphodiesterase/nucleotide pyrophosphatase [Lutibacter sp. Hel_I_33_5]
MKKLSFIFICISLFIFSCQKKDNKQKSPKLVIGIVVDQMRYDYLTRFEDRYGEGGFKRIIQNGFSLENAHYNYVPTYTAVGHASIYTGTTPNNHGIIGNWWYDKFLKKSIYCVDDKTYNSVGTETNKGKKSPYRLFTTTLTDQLKLAQNNNGKTIGIAIKDRSAILPVGHTGNAAYWFDNGENGRFISSSFYMNDLPNWVKEFNNQNNAKKYVSQPWNTLYDIKTYTNSISDNNTFEEKFKGEETPTFPHDLPSLMKENDGIGIIKETPFGNTLTLDFAKAAILGENLGKNKATDFLSISFSSTDYVGHRFGVDAVETEDTYLRLDKDLADLFSFLDTQVGKENYTIFLTSDHGAARAPSYLQSLKIPAPYFDAKDFKTFVNSITKKYFRNDELVENISNFQLFLNKEKIESLGLQKEEIINKLVEETINYKTIYKAISAKTLQNTNFTTGILNSIQNGYNQKFSGDVLLVPNPSTISSYYKKGGTTHGSGFSYDTHVPIIFYGNGIKKGSSKKKYEIIDITPTLSNLLHIETPNGSTGKIIDEVLKK